MPFPWHLCLSVLSAILRLIASLPADVDHRDVCAGAANVMDALQKGHETTQ